MYCKTIISEFFRSGMVIFVKKKKRNYRSANNGISNYNTMKTIMKNKAGGTMKTLMKKQSRERHEDIHKETSRKRHEDIDKETKPGTPWRHQQRNKAGNTMKTLIMKQSWERNGDIHKATNRVHHEDDRGRASYKRHRNKHIHSCFIIEVKR